MDIDDHQVQEVLDKLKRMAYTDCCWQEQQQSLFTIHQRLYERAMAQIQRKRKKIQDAQIAQMMRQQEEQAALTFHPSINKGGKNSRNLQQFLKDQQQWTKKRELKRQAKKGTQEHESTVLMEKSERDIRNRVKKKKNNPDKAINKTPQRELKENQTNRPRTPQQLRSQQRLKVLLGQLKPRP